MHIHKVYRNATVLEFAPKSRKPLIFQAFLWFRTFCWRFREQMPCARFSIMLFRPAQVRNPLKKQGLTPFAPSVKRRFRFCLSPPVFPPKHSKRAVVSHPFVLEFAPFAFWPSTPPNAATLVIPTLPGSSRPPFSSSPFCFGIHTVTSVCGRRRG